MARQVIDLTTPQPGGRQGEPTASAWQKVNDMTLEIYQSIGGMAGYISGLIPRYTIPNGCAISSGAAYIQSAGRVVEVPDITVQGSLQVNTWYHIYLTFVSGVLGAEIVSSAPTVYSGTARNKLNDGSRRYIYSLKTDSSGAIIPFIVQSDGMFRYCIGNPVAPLRRLADGRATTRTTVSLSAAMPETSIGGLLLISNTDTTMFANLTIPGVASAAIVGVAPGGGTSGQFVPHPTDASQNLQYYYASTPASGLYIDVIGFTIAR